MNAATLRKKYPRFFYKKYSFKKTGKDLHILFDFAAPPDISFHPKIVLKNVPKKSVSIENLVFHLGLVEMLSYWKATASPEIVIEAGYLEKKQIAWFKDLLLQGMGEYFFQNKIDFTKKSFLSITSGASKRNPEVLASRLKDETLVPIGGGKDAAVTLELLKKAGIPVQPFLLNPKPEQRKILALAKAKHPIVAERTIDPRLLELNRKGYLNGHTPFSAYLAFLSLLCAALFDAKYIALSNERSSNEGNVKYRGKNINHQYSKSYDFEKKFRAYSRTYLVKGAEYFSFLRPLYELQIAKIFARYPKYFPAFLSCNEAYKTKSGSKKPTGKWCGKCPKCLFVFLILSPFVTKKQMKTIFKGNLLRDKKLKPLLDELTGKKRFKPFECVGTAKETGVALLLLEGDSHPMLYSWNKLHFLPERFKTILKRELK